MMMKLRKQITKTENPETRKERRDTRIRHIYVAITALLVGIQHLPAAYAVDPVTAINTLTSTILDVAQIIGILMCVFGVLQIGMSINSHDNSQRMQGFLALAGGIIVAGAKSFLALIGITI